MIVSPHSHGAHSNVVSRISARRSPLSRSQLAWGGYVLAIGFYALFFGLWQIEPVPIEAHALGVFIAAICLFPLAFWTAQGGKSIPAFELVCIAYLLAFSSPLYLGLNQVVIFSKPVYFNWDDTYRALLLALTGVVSMIVGYYIVHLSKVKFKLLQIDLPLHSQKRLRFVKLAFAIGFALIIVRAIGIDLSAGAFNSLVGVIENQVYVAIVVLAYRVFQGQESPAWRIALYGAVGLAALFGLAGGMLETALVPVILLAIVRWNATRKFPFLWLLAGMAMFIVLNSVKGAYREQAWKQDSSLGVGERINLWTNLGQQSTTGEGASIGLEGTIRTSMGRFDLLHTLTWVQHLTPNSIPYYEGRTYGYLFYGWIPRVIWPDKPIAQGANVTFAVDYKFMYPEQTSGTMIGIGHLGESYANFGPLGIVIIMALQGMFLAAVNKMLNGPQSEGGKAIYLSLMVFFLNGIGSATASLFMAIPLMVIVSGVILRFFATGWRATPIKAKRLTSSA